MAIIRTGRSPFPRRFLIRRNLERMPRGRTIHFVFGEKTIQGAGRSIRNVARRLKPKSFTTSRDRSGFSVKVRRTR